MITKKGTSLKVAEFIIMNIVNPKMINDDTTAITPMITIGFTSLIKAKFVVINTMNPNMKKVTIPRIISDL